MFPLRRAALPPVLEWGKRELSLFLSTLVLAACVRSGTSPSSSTVNERMAPTHSAELPYGDFEYFVDGSPTGGISIWAPPPGGEVVVRARLRIGDLEHAWEVGRVVDTEMLLRIEVPPAGIMTTLQEFAMSDLYVNIDAIQADGEVFEQVMRPLVVVWTGGLEADPTFYTVQQAIHTWPGGVVGVVGRPGEGVSQPADAVREWMEVNP